MSDLKYKYWSDDEIQFLISNITLSDKEIAGSLGRSINSVKWKRKELGFLRDKPGKWSKDEEMYLIENKHLSLKKLADSLGRTKESISRKKNRLKITNIDNGINVKHEINIHFFKKWSEDMAYILGFIYADGYIIIQPSGYKLGITIKDVSLLKKISYRMDSNYPIKKKNGRSNVYSMVIYRKEIVDDLMKLGVKTRKSLDMEFPNIPNDNFWSFVRGYFDGDGHISLRKGNSVFIAFYCGSKNFITKLEDEFKKRKIVTSLKKDKRKNSCYELSILKPSKETFYDHLYKDCTIYLSRKYQLFFQYYEETMKITCVDCNKKVRKRSSSHKRCKICSGRY